MGRRPAPPTQRLRGERGRCLVARIVRPLSRPAGSSRGSTPPTAQWSDLRGLNGTVTRSPAANLMRSFGVSQRLVVLDRRLRGIGGGGTGRIGGIHGDGRGEPRQQHDPGREGHETGARGAAVAVARTGDGHVARRSSRRAGGSQPRPELASVPSVDGPGRDGTDGPVQSGAVPDRVKPGRLSRTAAAGAACRRPGGQCSGKTVVVACVPPLTSVPQTLNATWPVLPVDFRRMVAL